MTAPIPHQQFVAFPTCERMDAIALWRGKCIGVFARGEQAVLDVLLAATEAGQKVRFDHLAGQRLQALEALNAAVDSSEKQTTNFKSALDSWRSLAEQRRFIAHGVSSTWTGENGAWLAVFDLNTCLNDKTTKERWTIRHDEVDLFFASLQESFARLKQQLGTLRVRLKSI